MNQNKKLYAYLQYKRDFFVNGKKFKHVADQQHFAYVFFTIVRIPKIILNKILLTFLFLPQIFILRCHVRINLLNLYK